MVERFGVVALDLDSNRLYEHFADKTVPLEWVEDTSEETSLRASGGA